MPLRFASFLRAVAAAQRLVQPTTPQPRVIRAPDPSLITRVLPQTRPTTTTCLRLNRVDHVVLCACLQQRPQAHALLITDARFTVALMQRCNRLRKHLQHARLRVYRAKKKKHV